jgi:hypothetical protein
MRLGLIRIIVSYLIAFSLLLVFSYPVSYNMFLPARPISPAAHTTTRSLESLMPLRRLVGSVLLALPLSLGCSGSNTAGKVSVSGSVSLKGASLQEGLVQFEPLEKQSTSAAVVLVGGSYTVSAANGLQPGMYRVRISTADGGAASGPLDPNKPLGPSGSNLPGGHKAEAKRPSIPPEWGDKSKQQVEVKADGPNKFDFDIK